MFITTIQKVLDTAIIRCHGRMTLGENFLNLRRVVSSQATASVTVLDLAGVRGIDAAGLGLLLDLRKRAHANASRFKLINVVPRVQRVLSLTKLDRVFEFCSVCEMLDLLHLARAAQSAAVGNYGIDRTAVRCKPPAA